MRDEVAGRRRRRVILVLVRGGIEPDIATGKARFHLQDKEMNFATGRHMCKGPFRHAYECEDIVGMDGDVDVATRRPSSPSS